MEKYFYFAKVKLYDSDKDYNLMTMASSYNEAMNNILTDCVEDTEVENIVLTCGFPVYGSIPNELFIKLKENY